MIISHEMFTMVALVKNAELIKDITQLNHFEAEDESNSYGNIEICSSIIICEDNIENISHR